MISKLKTALTWVIFISLFFIFFDSIVNREVFAEKYGFSATAIAIVFGIAEVFFNLGIFFMLRGSGIFKIKWRDLISFNFKSLNFNSRQFFVGFTMNRLAAFVPWVYILGVGWKNLPMALIGLVTLELIIVVILTLSIFEVTSKYENAKS